MGEAAAQTDEDMQTYTAIFYSHRDATLRLTRVTPDKIIERVIAIADFLTSSTDLPIILTDDGELDVKW